MILLSNKLDFMGKWNKMWVLQQFCWRLRFQCPSVYKAANIESRDKTASRRLRFDCCSRETSQAIGIVSLDTLSCCLPYRELLLLFKMHLFKNLLLPVTCYLSRSLGGRWGTEEATWTSFLHSSLWCALACSALPLSPVQSLMSSIHVPLGLPGYGIGNR